MPEPAEVSAADIARLARVSRGTVSNWRRRHADFPSPHGGTDANPAYDRAEVETWLSSRGMLPEPSLDDLLWRLVMQAADKAPLNELIMQATRLLGELDECVKSYGPDRPVYDEARLAEVKERLMAEAQAGTRDTEFLTAMGTVVAKHGPLTTMESLFERYAESTGMPTTPPPVADLMAELAVPRHEEVTVFDPAAGTGELLAAAFTHGAWDVCGKELDSGLAALAHLRLNVLKDNGPYSAAVIAGDSLRDDQLPGIQADVALCHPPFADREWGMEELAHDSRWVYGTPPKSEPELAWVQHCLAHLVPGGIAALLLPPAVASRASGRRIRAELLRRGVLRAVIALPSGAVRPRHVPVHMWLLTRPDGRVPLDPRVLLVDGATLTDREAENGEGTDAGWGSFRAMTLRAWQAFAGEDAPSANTLEEAEAPGDWRIVRAIDLLDESVDVSPARHVAPPQAALSPSRTRDEVRVLSRRLHTAMATAQAALPSEDWRLADRDQGWHAMTVDDLVRTGMAEFYRASSKRPEVLLRSGDVIVSAVAGASRGIVVVTRESLMAKDSGIALRPHEHLIRPAPEVLDPWFLAGFLAAPANVKQASYGTAATRIDARRLTVPLLPIDQQRRYAAVFQRLHQLADAVTQVNGLAAELADLLAWSLADGTLQPPDSDGTPDTAAQ
jgi:N-6 DNA Methylase